jgi:hypothetical protein
LSNYLAIVYLKEETRAGTYKPKAFKRDDESSLSNGTNRVEYLDARCLDGSWTKHDRIPRRSAPYLHEWYMYVQ